MDIQNYTLTENTSRKTWTVSAQIVDSNNPNVVIKDFTGANAKDLITTLFALPVEKRQVIIGRLIFDLLSYLATT